MDEADLGRIAYEASHYYDTDWNDLDDDTRDAWEAVGKAVAEHVHHQSRAQGLTFAGIRPSAT